ncbi:MAG: alanine racemase [Desulfobacterales bacterium]
MENSLIWAEIDLGAIAHNVAQLRKITSPKAKLMAVVKADAYGHGAVQTAKAALSSGADVLGVARINEAIVLRQAGISAPIQIFGYTPPLMTETLIKHDLTQTVFSYHSATELSKTALAHGKKIRIHIKVDTGMGRLGLTTDCLEISSSDFNMTQSSLKQVESIVTLPGVIAEGIMTHFASADSADKTFAKKQFAIFSDFIHHLSKKGIKFEVRHAANSAAVMDLPESHLDLVRPGISIYGLYASDEVDKSKAVLKPVMALKAKVVHVKKVPSGFSVSYGHTYRTRKPTTIATVSAGYADGFNRLFSSCGFMLVRGIRAPVIGRVCMDLTMLDVGHIPDVNAGDEVVIFGTQNNESIHVDELAKKLSTINYEIVSTITARVPRVYIPENE